MINRKLHAQLPSTEHSGRGPHYWIRQRRNYNKSARLLPPLAENDIVRVRSGIEWGPMAKVLRETSPRSYKLETEQGNVL